jgi:hypothetical protein
MAGHYAFDRGIKTVSEIEAHYSSTPLYIEDIIHNVLIININKTYLQNKNIYEATRKYWKLDMRKVKKIDYVLAEYKGIVRAIFKPLGWYRYEKEQRVYFEGNNPVDISIEKLYLNKSLPFKIKGTQNPLRYVFGRK